MRQYFDPSSSSLISVDDRGQTRALLHIEPVFGESSSVEQAALEYLLGPAQSYGIGFEQLANFFTPPDASDGPNDASVEYRLQAVKQTMDIATVDIVQTMRGLVVSGAGVAVQILVDPRRAVPRQILSSTFTGYVQFQLVEPSRDALPGLLGLRPEELGALLGLDEMRCRLKSGRLLDPVINLTRYRIYRYQSRDRLPPTPDGEGQTDEQPLPRLPIAPVADVIREGWEYAVAEIFFTLSVVPWGKLSWMAMVEPDTFSVLYLRAFVDNAKGFVFTNDPLTVSADPRIGPRATSGTLDPFRELVELDGLNPASSGSEVLSGEWVKLDDCYAPRVAAPTLAVGTDFDFSSRTNDFGAVNAYYHCDALFRMMQGMGFDVRGYFDGTSFPIPVDHRASTDPDGIFGGNADNDGNRVNAQSLGNELRNGQGALIFLLADAADFDNPLGAAVDRRVVHHEFGHTLLWDHVHDCNFGFAHSCGDTIAAVLGDVVRAEPFDRGISIPFTHQSLTTGFRRHDHPADASWAWGGSRDDKSYGSEQILSSTLFRAYRAIGGDHLDLAKRELPARTIVYLIIRAIGTLTPACKAAHAMDFANALMTVDAGDWEAEGLAGGAYHKVIRWAFEMQGLYRPQPSNGSFGPPPVDVYIEDGRGGHYEFAPSDGGPQVEIWNRTSPGDGDGAHEQGVARILNRAYVRIRTRGTLRATGVVVRGFEGRRGGTDAYPSDWLPMNTGPLTIRDLEVAIPSDSVVAGPFDWFPTAAGEQSLFFSVSAVGDPSNIDARITGSIERDRLLNHDNNLAYRRVTVVEHLV